MPVSSSVLNPLAPQAPTSNQELRYWQAPHGSAEALALARLADESAVPLLVMTPDTASAQRMEGALRFYSSAPDDILVFPDWETLPYDSFSPHQDIVSSRLRTLRQLQHGSARIVLVPVNTLMQRLPPSDFVAIQALRLEVGMRIDREHFRHQLHRSGYRAVETVQEPGEYAFRGALIDLYPVGSEAPLRIDLFDDELDTLRTFDPDTQRSRDRIEHIELLPAHEYPLTPEAIARFREGFETLFDVDPRHCPLYLDALQGIPAPGLEQYLPLFFEETATLFDHIGDRLQIAMLPGTYEAAETHWDSIQTRFENLGVDPTRPLLAPHRLFTPVSELFERIKRYPRLQITREAHRHAVALATEALPEVAVDGRSTTPLKTLEQFLTTYSDQRVLFVAESRGRREALEETLAPLHLTLASMGSWSAFMTDRCQYALTEGELDEGLWLHDEKVVVLTETELFGEVVRQSRRQQKATDDSELAVRHLSELRQGAPVVHQHHGVGRYLGLETIEAGGTPAEFLSLEYAEGARLYVPVDSLHLISRYNGASDESAPLHRLGSDQWDKARRKAAERVRDTAAELLDVYARREAREGFACDPPDDAYARFAASFPFEETPDQRIAIDAVIHDMTSTQPMDRVICGDVGFGKTEVAMRAAFLAVQSGRQVAVLVPTTLLAQQHYDNFRDRFADTAVNIEILSRFQGGKLQSRAFERISDGRADIVIGTHKLLGRELDFANLGLIIVDEEHRFGVSQKERLKQLRAEVDILTLTATPIPRTLSMAMSGMRDLSIIATPPARRLSVKTFVQQRNEATLKEAILRELLRGGQVYYLHNEVRTIESTAEKVRELVPDARVGIAHGQMAERALERAMSDFYHKRFNVLVCSTIIETGIDVPSANTIIIERADKFGLAQLHQLRGRVGRSHHQAYAYLLTPPPKQMTADAGKRLEAISQAEDLGAGFTLASHDLEIRGAGELLGQEQSGQIETIGYTLYMEMLDRAVKAIRNGQTPNIEAPLDAGIEISLNMAALIPEEYLRDVQQRLIMYKRISNANSEEELRELQVEMVDRFGLLPDAVRNLFRQTRLRLQAARLGVTRLEAGEQKGRIQFTEKPAIDPMTLIELIQKEPKRYRLDGSDTLRFEAEMAEPEKRFEAVEALLDRLEQQAQAA
ncbi:transcription-repair coupling factor [Kushneria phosphatilytica]|uniref:Transcription-repair-coupling factor n=1 Tax=Kushneria phosphatilytica TaxID=657387 RepID=A0A1S1P0W1_9GAMM|nr:transcription-repair coupling factor [Kushneria phosphatilytica]OHV13068.1 transcription-repair coupling factor [Kushneria phosphatilytica]QEL10940.1 transcription-repair coupling factor [Kushneria phosphatilytica]